MFQKKDIRNGSLVNLDLADCDVLGDDAVATVRVVDVPEHGAIRAMICDTVPQYFTKAKERGDSIWFAPHEIIEIVRY